MDAVPSPNSRVFDSRVMVDDDNSGWGRTLRASRLTAFSAGVLIIFCPIWVTMNWMSLEYFEGSLTTLLRALWSSDETSSFLIQHLPRPTWTSAFAYVTWLLFQGVLYHWLPGKIALGQQTPGGNKLSYNINGVMAWAITHLLFAVAVVQGWLDPACIAVNWPGLFVSANIYGYILAAFVYLKALHAPTHVDERKFSGSWMHDFWMGLELNPRLGSFDLKFFHNGRPGIVAWSLIDLSFMAWQFEKHGWVSNSMLLVVVLHTVYVLDFFVNEDWYLKTMDITHDHFGMMLAWGDVVFLPSFYTIQAQYLAKNPVSLSNTAFTILLVFGLGAYAVFRAANSEKVNVREADGKITIWGRSAKVLRCSYRTADGKKHQSMLLICGWWSIARHANYTADLALAWTMCAPCIGDGFAILPWTYFLFQVVLLLHRIIRGEQSCRIKYGPKWDEYCRLVPWRLVPGVY